MDAPYEVDVPARSATGPRPLIGEPLALDLINTVWRQAGVDYDLLVDDDGLRRWIDEHADEAHAGPLVVRPPAASRLADQRAALVEARTAIRGVLSQRDDASACAALNAVLAHGQVRATLTAGEPTEAIEFDDSRWSLPWRAAQSLLVLLRDRPERVRGCAGEGCSLFFLDVTRSGTRRWCSMERCGNRAKARRHYARVRTEG